jgi:hypothetical protein
VGTFKFGRDIGFFGADAILNDLTIFGVGTPNANFAPTNTALGRIGVGYIYADWIPQFSYTSPDIYGFTMSAGIFTPLDAWAFAGFEDTAAVLSPANNNLSATITGQDQPMVQGRLKYVGSFGGSECGLKDPDCLPTPAVKLTLSTSFVYQDHQVETRDLLDDTINPLLFRAGDTLTSWGWDGFGRLDWGPVSIVGYGYTGNGLGHAGFFWDAFSFNGQARNSEGGYAQASYTFFDTITVGGSWGISTLDSVPGDSPFLFKNIQSAIGFVRYKLTDWVNLQAEYVHTEERNNCTPLACGVANGRSLVNDDAVIFGTTFFW